MRGAGVKNRRGVARRRERGGGGEVETGGRGRRRGEKWSEPKC